MVLVRSDKLLVGCPHPHSGCSLFWFFPFSFFLLPLPVYCDLLHPSSVSIVCLFSSLHLWLAAPPPHPPPPRPYQYSSHWLQGFPTCIYRVFIGAEPCFLSAYQQPRCTPPTNFPDTALGFQDTTGPGCSRSQLTRP